MQKVTYSRNVDHRHAERGTEHTDREQFSWNLIFTNAEIELVHKACNHRLKTTHLSKMHTS